ncbi:MAG: flagellar protein FlgN [Proteobacteria bacterium]|nr:flagellar protein FlgN [Pseudomonadota bacterium]
MESFAARIESLLNEKILLFQELVEILKEEKKSIVDIDVDKLWVFSEKKQAVASKIEDIRKQIIHILDEESIDHNMAVSTFSVGKVIEWIRSDEKAYLNQINVTLILLKKKVHALASENKKFISEYLGVMDELIGTISNIGDKAGVYENSRFPKRQKKTSYMLNTEV